MVVWIAKQFQKTKVTPNQVSIMGTILAIGGSIIFYFIYDYWGSLLFGIFIFFAGIFDGVDGTLARLTKRESILGGYYDSIMDRYADTIIMLSFLGHYSSLSSIIGVPCVVWVVFALMGTLLVSYTRARAEAAGIKNCDVGLAARSERLFTLVIFSILNYAYIGLVILAIITHLTAIYRIYFVHRELKS
ncbi:MAG: CDP-alcohol phosphatidyltransferase family protein [Candidatus Helarchaeota archaeon]